MTITSVGAFFSGNNKTLGTDWASTAGDVLNNASVGDVIVFVLSSDNSGTVTGLTTNHVSILDNVGNAWSKIGEVTKSSGAAADGVTISCWVSKIKTAITTSATITLKTSSVTAKAATAWIFRSDSNEDFDLVYGFPSNPFILFSDGFTYETRGGADPGSLAFPDTVETATRINTRGTAYEGAYVSDPSETAGFTTFNLSRSHSNTAGGDATDVGAVGEFIVSTSRTGGA